MEILEKLRGSIIDVDSHEMIPTGLWGDRFGPVGGLMGSMLETVPQDSNNLSVDVSIDELSITPDTVWQRSGWEVEGPRAPGAIDMVRRVDVLDLMGVKRQLVFPSFGLIAIGLCTISPEWLAAKFGWEGPQLDPAMLMQMSQAACKGYNDWVIEETARIGSDRIRLVGVVLNHTLDEMMSEAERLLAGGVRCLQLPASIPPGGKSPADRELGPFWSMCEEADATVCLHVVLENFMRSDAWRQVPEFDVDPRVSNEFMNEPWSFSVLHMVVENYLNTMIMGGVFERHPKLRFGTIECGAHWVGPMADNLDKWANVFSKRMSKILSEKPSYYVQNNLRVSAFLFEAVDQYVERFGLEDVYCYASDYPHIEGGLNQMEVFAKKVEHLGPGFAEKFFVTNGEFLVPGAAS